MVPIYPESRPSVTLAQSVPSFTSFACRWSTFKAGSVYILSNDVTLQAAPLQLPVPSNLAVVIEKTGGCGYLSEKLTHSIHTNNPTYKLRNLYLTRIQTLALLSLPVSKAKHLL